MFLVVWRALRRYLRLAAVRSSSGLEMPVRSPPSCAVLHLPSCSYAPSRSLHLAALLATPADVAEDFMAKSRALVAAVQTFNLAVSPGVAAVLAPVAALAPTPAPPPQEGVVIVDPNQAEADAVPVPRAGSYVRGPLRLIRITVVSERNCQSRLAGCA